MGLLLRGVRREEVARGQVVTLPGVVQLHDAGIAEVYALSAAEGGRHTPFTSGYQPVFFFGGKDVTGAIVLAPGEREVVRPGDHARIEFRLGKKVGIEPGMRFALREGGKTVGAGVVTKVT